MWSVHNKNKNGGGLKRKYANKARTWNHCHFLVFVLFRSLSLSICVPLSVAVTKFSLTLLNERYVSGVCVCVYRFGCSLISQPYTKRKEIFRRFQSNCTNFLYLFITISYLYFNFVEMRFLQHSRNSFSQSHLSRESQNEFFKLYVLAVWCIRHQVDS